jgi:hypothetical protein
MLELYMSNLAYLARTSMWSLIRLVFVSEGFSC